MYSCNGFIVASILLDAQQLWVDLVCVVGLSGFSAEVWGGNATAPAAACWQFLRGFRRNGRVGLLGCPWGALGGSLGACFGCCASLHERSYGGGQGGT